MPFRKSNPNYRSLKKLSMTRRLDALFDPQLGFGILQTLTPSQASELFPRYWQERYPDIGGFIKALPSSVSAARQREYERQLGNTAEGSREGEKFTGPGTELNRNQKAMQKSVYDAYRSAGFSDNQARALTAEVGRENAYNPQYIFGTHSDPANSATNLGMISMQGPRHTGLYNFLKSRNLIRPDGNIMETQEALVAMAQYQKQEMETGNHGGNPEQVKRVREFLNNPDVDPEQASRVLGRDYIRWRYDDPQYAHHHQFRRNYLDQINRTLGEEQSATTGSTEGLRTVVATGRQSISKGDIVGGYSGPSQECAAYAQGHGVGLTKGWTPGQSAKEGGLKQGDWIAAFHGQKYMNWRNSEHPGDGSHVARFESYIRDDKGNIIGMNVTHQWNGSGGLRKGEFYFGSSGEMNADRYSQIVDRGKPASMTVAGQQSETTQASSRTDIPGPQHREIREDDQRQPSGERHAPGRFERSEGYATIRRQKSPHEQAHPNLNHDGHSHRRHTEADSTSAVAAAPKAPAPAPAKVAQAALKAPAPEPAAPKAQAPAPAAPAKVAQASPPAPKSSTQVTSAEPPTKVRTAATGGNMPVNTESISAYPINELRGDNAVVVNAHQKPLFTMNTNEKVLMDPNKDQAQVIPENKMTNVGAVPKQDFTSGIREEFNSAMNEMKKDFANLLPSDRKPPQRDISQPTMIDSGWLDRLTHSSSDPLSVPTIRRVAYRAGGMETGDPSTGFHFSHGNNS